MDVHPDREIGRWMHLRECYLHFTDGKGLRLEQKRDIFKVIVATSVNGAQFVSQTVSCQTLSKKRVRGIAGFVEGTWRCPKGV